MKLAPKMKGFEFVLLISRHFGKTGFDQLFTSCRSKILIYPHFSPLWNEVLTEENNFFFDIKL